MYQVNALEIEMFYFLKTKFFENRYQLNYFNRVIKFDIFTT
jgi:hypothetical protein